MMVFNGFAFTGKQTMKLEQAIKRYTDSELRIEFDEAKRRFLLESARSDSIYNACEREANRRGYSFTRFYGTIS